VRKYLTAYKRVRRIEFAELPKTNSGKIRRVELRGREQEVHGTAAGDNALGRAGKLEFWQSDFPGFKH